MKSYFFVGLGFGTAVGAILLQLVPAAIVSAGCFIAAGLYRIAEK